MPRTTTLLACVAIVALAIVHAAAGASPQRDGRPGVPAASFVALSGSHTTTAWKLRISRLWAVQVSGGRYGWLDLPLLRSVRREGVNALVVDVGSLGVTKLAWKPLARLRRFASAERMSLIAIVPDARPLSPAAAYALTLCGERSDVMRCAEKVHSPAAAARRARLSDPLRPLVALTASGPGAVRSSLSFKGIKRQVLVVVPLYRGFKKPLWSAAIGAAGSSDHVALAVAPQGRAATSSVKRFASVLSEGGGKAPASVPAAGGSKASPPPAPVVEVAGTTPTTVTLSWSPVLSADGSYEIYVNDTLARTVAATTSTVSSLTCGASYSFGVVAVDPTGMRSVRASVTAAPGPCSGGGDSGSGAPASTTSAGATATTSTPKASATPPTAAAAPAADTIPPSIPSRLSTASVGQTAITLAWAPSSDNVGVAHYDVLVAGIAVGSTPTTSYTFSGLTCGTTYTFGVEATDAAHNTSAASSVIAATAGCPVVMSSDVWVAPAPLGNDTTCVQGDSTKPCASLATACQKAGGGDTVYLSPGLYGSQDVSTCTGKSSTVTITAETGHLCSYSAATDPASLPLQSSDTTCDVTIGKLTAVGASVSNPAASNLKNLTIAGIYIQQAIYLKYVHGVTLDHVESPMFFVVASDGVTISNSDFGNVFNGDCSVISNAGNGTPDSSNVVVKGNVFHDEMRLLSTQSHPDGLFIQGLVGGTITGNVFYRDAVIPLYLNSVAGGSIQNITISNNVIHSVVDMTDSGSSTVSNVGVSQQALSLGDNTLSNITVAFNSIEGYIRRQDTSNGGGSGTTSGLRIFANVADGMVFGNSYGCGDNTTYGYNFWYGGSAVACDSTSAAPRTNVLPFASGDVHPSAATLGIYTLAPGVVPVAFVPSSWCAGMAGVCPAGDVTGASRPHTSHPAAYDAGAYENR